MTVTKTTYDALIRSAHQKMGAHQSFFPCSDCGKLCYYCNISDEYFHVDIEARCFLIQEGEY